MIIENPETVNKRLSDIFGKYLDDRPLWRLVFSHDQFEKRRGVYKDFTSEGFFLREVEEVREVPKYRQWINPPCYVLERLVEVPEVCETQLLEKTSYEPVWTFHDSNGNPLVPIWNAIKLIIDTVYENSARSVGVRYKDPREELTDPKIAADVREANLNKIEEELFGPNEQNPLSYGQGIVVPFNYNKEVN